MKSFWAIAIFFIFSIFSSSYFPLQATAENVEQKVIEISKKLRCPVCQTQSINDSDTSLARDIKKSIETQLLMGEKEEQVIAHITQRYGSYVLFEPPMKSGSYLLWLLPIIILLLGVVFIWRFLFSVRSRY